jgi:hypothetical protein
MKLILSQYIRSLKERDEFDRLLPDLLLAMEYVPISKPQIGVRQFGVDVAAVGTAEDGVQELLLLVIKRGDIDRKGWDSGPQSVRPSLNEVLDVYLRTHVQPMHSNLRKRVILASTGDLKQEVQLNWDGYVTENAARVSFDFWGADQIALLLERKMLNENIFSAESRTDLRKALALAAEIDYDQKDFHRLFRRLLGLSNDGVLVESSKHPADLSKSLRVVNLSTEIYSKWSEDEGNLKQSLVASERAVLWSWHRIQLEEPNKRPQYYPEFLETWRTYKQVAHRYFDKLQPHLYVKDGLSGYCHENAEFALVTFEQIGILATIGLSQLLVTADEEGAKLNFQNATVVAKALASLIANNPVSGSPRLDGNVIDITLALMLLTITNHLTEARDWLAELVERADFTFKIKRNFPIGTDSLDDLADATVWDDELLRGELMKTSWFLATLAGWAVILERNDLYDVLSKNTKRDYPEVGLQLWHPTEDVAKHLYYWQAQYRSGESEAPIILPGTFDEYRDRMKAILALSRLDIRTFSPALLSGMDAIDLVASRHFRTPVAPYFWYRMLPKDELPNHDGPTT